MPRTITFKGSSLTLIGRVLKGGTLAPDFRVVTQDLNESGLSDFAGKIKVITSFPSLDTPVCDLQVKEFNKRAAEFSADTVVLGISKDLPFAQKRFCQQNTIKNVSVMSDYKYSSFGINYGLLIKELNLLARAVVIVDKNNVLRYIRIAEELTIPLDYEAALVKLQEVIANPAAELPKDGLPAKCLPCEGGAVFLPKDAVEKRLTNYRGWQLIEDKKIVKEFTFSDFQDTKYFLDIICLIAREQGHHPNLTLIYNKLKVTLTTHSAGGLTENDFIMAKIIDEME